jgi:hypothetical protein
MEFPLFIEMNLALSRALCPETQKPQLLTRAFVLPNTNYYDYKLSPAIIFIKRCSSLQL